MIEIIEQKELKSTTKVTGVLVKVTGNVYYAVTKYMPPRDVWYLRACKATRTGRLSQDVDAQVYMKRTGTEAPIEEGVHMLMQTLNGQIDPPQDTLINHRR